MPYAQTVEIPFLKATLILSTNLLDELGSFSSFLLIASEEKATVEEICRVTQLQKFVILEEYRYLTKIGLVEQSTDELFLLTQRGHQFVNLIHVVEQFNKERHLVLINCITGCFEVYQEPNIEKEVSLQKLPSKIIYELYQNENPFNAKEILLEHFSFPEEVTEELNIEVELEYTPIYLSRSIKRIPQAEEQPLFSINEPGEEDEPVRYNQEEEIYITMSRTFLAVQWNLETPSLDEYQNVIDTLSRLNQFDDSLLSKKASKILLLAKEEEQLIKMLPILYIDQLTGEIHKEIPAIPNIVEQSKRVDVRMTPVFHHTSFKHEVLDNILDLLKINREKEIFKYSFIVKEEIHVTQKIISSQIF